MLIKRIAILGGTGFVGHSLCNHLAAKGYQTRVLTRNREYNRKNLILLPNLELVETNIHEYPKLAQQLQGCDAVINLVGILNEQKNDGSGFEQIHVRLVDNLIKACRQNNIQRCLHMSALNADAINGASYYLRSKGKAEDMLHADTTAMLVTSFRPSVIFGQHDLFFNRFASLLKITPLFFPLACHSTKFAPVYVDDVVKLMVQSLTNPKSFNQKYELCGAKIYTLRELVEYTAHLIGLKKIIIPLNDRLSRIQARVFDYIPGKPFSTDNYLSTKKNSVCRDCSFTQFGIQPKTVETVVPQYLAKLNYRSAYSIFRRTL